MDKINLKEILAENSKNYEKGLNVGREDYSLISGLEALRAMEIVWNLAVDFCNANAKLSEEESYRYSREHKEQISFFPIDTKSIEKVKEIIL